MATTPRLALRYPAAGDPNNVPLDMQRMAEDVENLAPGISVLTTVQRDALAGAQLWTGRTIFNSTTAQHEVRTAAGAWIAVGGSGGWFTSRFMARRGG